MCQVLESESCKPHKELLRRARVTTVELRKNGWDLKKLKEKSIGKTQWFHAPDLEGRCLCHKQGGQWIAEGHVPPVTPPDENSHTLSVLLGPVQLSLTHHPLSALLFFSPACSSSSPDKNCSLGLQPDATTFTRLQLEFTDAITSSLSRTPSTLTASLTISPLPFGPYQGIPNILHWGALRTLLEAPRKRTQ